MRPTRLTKSGAGTLTLGTSTNNLGGGQVVINGGVLTVDSELRFGTAGTSYSGVVLNGGTLAVTGNSTISGTFTLGLAGGTITHSNDSSDNIGSAGDLQFVGLGARTLTLANNRDNRTKTFRFSIGDNGGPTSVTIAGSGDSNVYVLSGANTYAATTVSAKACTKGCQRAGNLSTISDKRKCSLRCMAKAAPIMVNQMNEIETTSSIQTIALANT